METSENSQRILEELKKAYPDKSVYDLDGNGLHFVCEVEPVSEHPDFDKAVEVIIRSKPHKHLKTTQWYKVIKGALQLHIDDKVVILNEGDEYTVIPNQVHWAESQNEAWVEMLSKPGWTKEDHITV